MTLLNEIMISNYKLRSQSHNTSSLQFTTSVQSVEPSKTTEKTQQEPTRVIKTVLQHVCRYTAAEVVRVLSSQAPVAGLKRLAGIFVLRAANALHYPAAFTCGRYSGVQDELGP